MTYRYIEVKEIKSGEIVNRIDVTGKSDKAIERALTGMLINGNKDEFVFYDKEYDFMQPPIN